MSEEQQAAYIMAQAAAALIEALGMMSENLQRVHRGESLAYTGMAFDNVIERYGIDHNSVLAFFRG